MVDESLSTSRLANDAAVSLGLNRRSAAPVGRETQGAPEAGGSGSSVGAASKTTKRRAGETQETAQPHSRKRVAGKAFT